MIRRHRPIKSMQQLKEEQINVLLEYIEKKLEEYKKGITLRDNRIVEAKKKNFKGQKKVTIWS